MAEPYYWPGATTPGVDPETGIDTSTGQPVPGAGGAGDITGKSRERTNALTNYLDFVKWKRKELQNLITRYRTEFPQQIAAYKTSAYGALPEAKKNMWGGMYTNLNQRGLSDSSSFLAGARTDLEKWLSGEKGRIEETAQGMETSAQSAILAALGRPDYGSVYNNWVTADRQEQEYLDRLKALG